jgi:hypothetical protein
MKVDSRIHIQLKEEFPNLKSEEYKIESPVDYRYNCIAWAAGNSDIWWWPDKESIDIGSCYWPADVPIEETIDSFIKAYSTIGYFPCKNGDFESDYDKIVIYTNEGKPTHAARQIDKDWWTSKLGQGHDILHTLQVMENGYYGNATQFLKRLKI